MRNYVKLVIGNVTHNVLRGAGINADRYIALAVERLRTAFPGAAVVVRTATLAEYNEWNGLREVSR